MSKLTPLQVDFVEHMDDLAKDIGVQPNLLWLFLTDFPLFKKVLWGPVTAYQYRLMGPGKWEGARKAIFTQYDRMYQPLKTRQVWKKRLFCILWVLLYAPVSQSKMHSYNLFICLLQLNAQQSSTTGFLIKLSLTFMAGGAAIYYIHRNPTTISTLVSKLRPKSVWLNEKPSTSISSCTSFDT